jgi:carbon starvation protein
MFSSTHHIADTLQFTEEKREMSSVAIAFGAFAAYLIAYRTYGRFLAHKIFRLDPHKPTPAVKQEDGCDFVPTKLEVLFGHHYTSIAGTGPIVGPAIGIIWGWLPALLWVVFGSIFMGAVHDFGSVIVSARNEGRSIGDLTCSLISPRVRTVFLCIILLMLLIVIAVFCLVIAILFDLFPQAVIPVWAEIPIAIALGHCIYRKGIHPLPASLIAVALMYVTVVIGAYHPIAMPKLGPLSPVALWTILLLIYAAIASVLPVWRLLQPRDYINGHELFIAMGLLVAGVLLTRPAVVAPVFNPQPAGAPPLWPFLFVIIACGAISGFHSLVASGTTSKQLRQEEHALPIGYGGMLVEGALAVLVIVAVAAGIGIPKAGSDLAGVAAWQARYSSWGATEGLAANVGAFIDGSAGLLSGLRIPWVIAVAIMGVFLASFAGTTLDTATRLQRYTITELARAGHLRPLTRTGIATLLAVITAGGLAFSRGGGAGGLILWPLFGAANQLLAALALLVLTVYLVRQNRPAIITCIPMLFMLVMTGWAMVYNMRNFYQGGLGSLHLLIIGGLIMALELWVVVEAVATLAQHRYKQTGHAATD